jgi:hypothetical protein
MEHTKEPWRVVNGVDVQAGLQGGLAYVSTGSGRGRTLDEACANAARIVAAVNACEGLTLDELLDLNALRRHRAGRRRLTVEPLTTEERAYRRGALQAIEFCIAGMPVQGDIARAVLHVARWREALIAARDIADPVFLGKYLDAVKERLP